MFHLRSALRSGVILTGSLFLFGVNSNELYAQVIHFGPNEFIEIAELPSSGKSLLDENCGQANDRFQEVVGFKDDFLDDVPVDPEKVINFGKAAWALIQAGRPIVDIRADSASALPEGLTSWQALEGWQPPASKNYSFTWNVFGVQVVNFEYSFVYTYGGSFRGKGKYLANVAIHPTKVKVLWGYKFSAGVQVPTVGNIGTAEDPVGAVQMLLTWTLESAISHQQHSANFYVTGNGAFKEISQM